MTQYAYIILGYFSQLPASSRSPYFQHSLSFSFFFFPPPLFATSARRCTELRQVRVVLQMFALQAPGSRGLAAELTAVCPSLRLPGSGSTHAESQANKPNERVSEWASKRWRLGDGCLPAWFGRGRIMTGASCLSSLGCRSVREASSWPMGPTDGASGWREKKPGQAFQMDLWMTHKPSHTNTHLLRVMRQACPCDAACRSCLAMLENRKGKWWLPQTAFLKLWYNLGQRCDNHDVTPFW